MTQAHFFAIHFEVKYTAMGITKNRTPKDVPYQAKRKLCAFLGLAEAKVTLPALKEAEDGVRAQLQAAGVKPDRIQEITYLGHSYMGEMTETEFTGTPETEVTSVEEVKRRVAIAAAEDGRPDPFALKN